MNLKISLVFLVFRVINCVLGDHEQINNYQLISKRFAGELSGSFLKNAINYETDHLNNNINCTKHIQKLLESIENEIWALQCKYFLRLLY